MPVWVRGKARESPAVSILSSSILLKKRESVLGLTLQFLFKGKKPLLPPALIHSKKETIYATVSFK